MDTLIPLMSPAPGERARRFVGDRIRFELRDVNGRKAGRGWRAFLRTNLGRAELLRREILEAHTAGLPLAGASWRDVPMTEEGDGWSIELPLSETGFFKAKAYLRDSRGWQHWPQGGDFGVSVHPDCYRTGNTLYCAFPRMFGASKTAATSEHALPEQRLRSLDESGFAVIPPSGKLNDLTRELPHIFDRLGCRILHLLPVNPTPTTYARFGRFGSPYAALDLTAIDPALVVFDRRTTGVDQFRALTYQAHLRGGRVILDMVINHTGWGSVFQENHPEWFLRNADGLFASPGAWGVTWEDLVELKHENVALWDQLADAFLTWCRRGVDGFRCDAGYKVPVAAWQYIIARVQQEYPNALFLLEGLGGSWEATDALLTEGGMQWAYSELFQNYSGKEVAWYLDHSLRHSERVGLLVHYSETHDNDRLAAKGREWALMRNRLCALGSVSGGFGFTCGVEWLAAEKIRVHGSSAMRWGSAENLVPELAKLNRLVEEHPCFYDGAQLRRVSAAESPVYALHRKSAEGGDQMLVLVNTDVQHAHKTTISGTELKECKVEGAQEIEKWIDVLGQRSPAMTISGVGITFTMPAGAAYCLSPQAKAAGASGGSYRDGRARAAWGLQALSRVLPAEKTGRIDWRKLSALVEQSPASFLASVSRLQPEADTPDLGAKLSEFQAQPAYSQVVIWAAPDRHRTTLVPPGHWLLVQDTCRFRAALHLSGESTVQNVESIPVREGQVACFPPRTEAGEAELLLERYAESDAHISGKIRFVAAEPTARGKEPRAGDLVLLTNGRGGMARMCIDLGRVLSKYDCVLAANLHPSLPVDRHVFVKRIRLWVNADGFISPLDFRSLKTFEAGPPAHWEFVANAGDGRTVEIAVSAEMAAGRNTTVFTFSRPSAAAASGKQLPAKADVRLTARLDVEDRNFHWETHRNGGAEHHFSTHIRALKASAERATAIAAAMPPDGSDAYTGFAFTPEPNRQLRVLCSSGCYHPQPEWSENIAHPVEASRGQIPAGDGYSPGWFEIPLAKGATSTLMVTAEIDDLEIEQSSHEEAATETGLSSRAIKRQPEDKGDDFAEALGKAIRAFVVKRDAGKTVIAGYPWFLDWGRDTFICARGLLAAGMLADVRQLVFTFARFEKDGTLPNTIFGTDASNRDTSDAPLWFGLVCEELAGHHPAVRQAPPAPSTQRSLEGAWESLDRITAEYLDEMLEGKPVSAKPEFTLYDEEVDESSRRTLLDILISIARNYIKGTPNGIAMDPGSGLIWSPSHFTWMDTNYPAGTPREGYPIEIQALWIRLLEQLSRVDPSAADEWVQLADTARKSFEKLFWLEERGYYSDVLIAKRGQGASGATADDALRSNCLVALNLGLAETTRAQRCVEAVRRYLVVPAALRSLAPLPVSVPLPIYGVDGRLLNDPRNPYWGRYEGDEDTRRKPAYHNGTAWTWPFPGFCEALARAWHFSAESVAAARAYLGSVQQLLGEGCLGQIPEVLDGDAPHAQRGCDAQAWSATEALRVWRLLMRRQ